MEMKTTARQQSTTNQAAKLAIEDAGIDKNDIDGLLTSGSFLNDNIRHHIVIAEHLGIDFADGSEGFQRELGGATTATANVRHAFPAVGNYNVTAAVFAASGESRMANVAVQVR